MTTGPKEIRDGRQLVRELSPRSAGSDYALASALGVKEGAYPSIVEDTDFITFLKGLRIRHTTPELRLEEVDQVDPAGRFRILVSDDQLNMQKAATANWGSILNFLIYTGLQLNLWSLSTDGSMNIVAGATNREAVNITLQADQTAPTMKFLMGDGVSALKSSMQINGGSKFFATLGSPDAVPTTAELPPSNSAIGYTKATNTAILYHNENGTIVSLVLGVMV